MNVTFDCSLYIGVKSAQAPGTVTCHLITRWLIRWDFYEQKGLGYYCSSCELIYEHLRQLNQRATGRYVFYRLFSKALKPHGSFFFLAAAGTEFWITMRRKMIDSLIPGYLPSLLKGGGGWWKKTDWKKLEIFLKGGWITNNGKLAAAHFILSTFCFFFAHKRKIFLRYRQTQSQDLH